MSTRIKGITVSPGIRIGKAYVYRGTSIFIPRYTITEEQVESEIQRFDEALVKAKSEIKGIQEQIAGILSNDLADIFSSHLVVLEDPQLDQKARDIIRAERRNIEWVLDDISLELIQSLKTIKDEYIRERIIDISDINKRLIGHLQKIEHTTLASIKEQVIVFAKNITPSDTATMDRDKVLAFVTDKGGRTSHTAIMARALEIPAIVGAINATTSVRDGDRVIVDAFHGEVIINPTPEEIADYTGRQEEQRRLDSELAKLIHLPSTTLDHEQIHIYGNIEIPDEMRVIKEHGAQGIGLFRSEFLFLDKSLPDEEKQFTEYKKVIEYFNPLPVTIRTLDIGGDKIFAYSNGYKDRNPFLGCRAIRFSLENIELFRTQIRAVLRASHYGNVKLMFPMVTILEELLRAREIVRESMDQLRRDGIPFDEKIPIGVMIEVPAAVIHADLLAKHADFFSVGTNDLVQYVLAVDRISEKIAYMYNPVNISILRFLKLIVDRSNRFSIPLSICGEIAGEPKYTLLLLGLGFRNFSMSPTSMYQIKRIVRSVKIKDCKKLVADLLKMELTKDIEERLFAEVNRKFPWLVY